MGRLGLLKKGILAAGIVLLLSVPFFGIEAFAATTKGVVKAVELYVRTSPDTDTENNVVVGGKKAILVRDQEITILGSVGDWYHIRAIVDGEVIEGYSKSGSSSDTWIEPSGKVKKESYVTGTVTAVELNVRKGPAATYDKVPAGDSTLILKKDMEITIIAVYDGWYYISCSVNGKDYNGFCLGDYISCEEGTKVAEIAQKNLSLYVDGEVAQTSEGPTKSEQLAQEDKSDKKDKKDKKEKKVPDGCIEVQKKVNSRFNLTGTITAGKVNIRTLAKKNSDVITVAKQGDTFPVINTVVKTTKKDGVSVKTRWYRVVVEQEMGYTLGYVMSDYVELDYATPINVSNKKAKQTLCKTPGGTKYVKNNNKKKIKLAKSTPMTLIGEALDKNGAKWYLVSYTVDDVTYEGYIANTDLAFETTVSKYIVSYYVPIEQLSEVTENPGVETEVMYEFKEANAIVKNAPALTVHSEALWASPVVRDSKNNPVMLYTGDSVEVISTVSVDDTLWCNIRFFYDGNEYTGYISKEHIEPDASLKLMSEEEVIDTTKLDFEAKLTLAGFPESYKPALRALHEKYPLWEFKAFHTGYTWKDAIDNEDIVGKNLIPNTKSIEWKSLAAGSYSWKNDSFVVFDGSTWVTASREAIEYYMDPRNFLDENTIFQFELLTYTPQFQGTDAIESILKNTAMAGTSFKYSDELGNKHTIGYADTFLMAAVYSGVSPLHLASRVKQEVTIGPSAMSNSVTGTVSGYEGLYNYYNIGAYHSTEAGGAIKNGLKFAKNGSSSESTNINCLIPWVNPFKAILGGAYYIGSNYINRGQNTIYTQKFNVTATNTYAHQYMANVEAPWAEGKRVFTAYEDPVATPIVFSIPVFIDMPETACPYPVHVGSPNNWLKSLKIYDKDGNKLSITPSLNNSSDKEYSLVVDSTVDYLKINATPVSSTARVTSDKNVSPEYGMNRFVVTVAAENGDVKEFVLNIFREEAEGSLADKSEGDDEGEPVPEDEGTGAEGQTTDSDDGTGDQTPEGDPAGASGQDDGGSDPGASGQDPAPAE